MPAKSPLMNGRAGRRIDDGVGPVVWLLDAMATAPVDSILGLGGTVGKWQDLVLSL